MEVRGQIDTPVALTPVKARSVQIGEVVSVADLDAEEKIKNLKGLLKCTE
jgi:hypothetical protein